LQEKVIAWLLDLFQLLLLLH